MTPKSSTPTTESANPGFSGDLKHTDEFAPHVTTRDVMDAGVPMVQGDPSEAAGPEDAFGPGPKRGDYRDRLDTGPHMVTRAIPEDERRKRAEAIASGRDGLTVAEALGEVPTQELVPADGEVDNIGDAPGKGGVSTEEAREQAAEVAGTGGTGDVA